MQKKTEEVKINTQKKPEEVKINTQKKTRGS
jgi:hypothetical protein